VEYYGGERIKKFSDFNIFLEGVFNEGIKAAQAGIEFSSPDFLFFFISKSKNEGMPIKIDFVIGDFDNLEKVSKEKNTKFVMIKNITMVKEILG